MTKITAKQIQVIYALGAKTGTLEHGNKDDELHSIVYRVCGKTSVKDLTDVDFRSVVATLNGYLPQVDMMTDKQKGKAWRCIYRLVELDQSQSKGKAGTRMLGAIKKILNVEAEDVKNPFKGLTLEQGEKLIESLKRYVVTEEKKVKKDS